MSFTYVHQGFPITVARPRICVVYTLRRNHRCRRDQQRLGHLGPDWIFVRVSWSYLGVGFDERHSLIWLTIRYGEQMRAFVDVGYPNFDVQALNDDDTTAQN